MICPALWVTACTSWSQCGDVLHRRELSEPGKFSSGKVEPLARAPAVTDSPLGGHSDLCWNRTDEDAGEVANFIAKKRPQYAGVCDLRDGRVRAELLPMVPLEELWGIGGALAPSSRSWGSRRPQTWPRWSQMTLGR